MLTYPYTPPHYQLLHIPPLYPIIAATICSSTCRRCDRNGLHYPEPSLRNCTHASCGSSIGSKAMTRASSRSPIKSIANTVCPIYPRSCLNLDRSPLPQGWRTFNITLNHPPSRFLRHPAILPFEPRTFTHNNTCVPIVAYPKADLVDDNPDLVDVGASGMGAIWMRMGGAHRRDHAN